MDRQARVSVADVVYHVINSQTRKELKWSSLWRREKGSLKERQILSSHPIDLPTNYLSSVNELLKQETLELLRTTVNKGKPFGRDVWVEEMVDRYDLGHTVRGQERPRKN